MKYWLNYNLIRFRRFALQTIMIFIIQYLTVYHLAFNYPTLPMHPPLGIAWSMFYLFGRNSWYGLLFGEICGYSLSGVAVDITLLYAFIDTCLGYIGAILCLNVFTTDIRPLADFKAAGKFFNILAFIVCPFSAGLKLATVNTHYVFFNSAPVLTTKCTIHDCLQLWLADLNAILVISGLLLSWVYVPFSREKVDYSRTLLAVVIFFVIAVTLFVRRIETIFFITLAMLITVYFAKKYGYLIATALLFIMATIFTSYFIVWKQLYWEILGRNLYTSVQLVLLAFSIITIYIGHKGRLFSAEKTASRNWDFFF